MIRVGILSVSDGRERVHEGLRPYILECEQHLRATLAATGEVELIDGGEVIYNNAAAKEIALSLASARPDAVIINVPVFAFPNFSLIAASLQTVPCLAIAPVNGKLPGLGGLQAAVNAIRQAGMQCEKVWGNIEDPDNLKQVMAFLRAAYAATSLRGQVYGLIGGRSIGMASGAVTPEVWLNKFGVDADHVDQSEILRRSALVEEAKVEAAFNWLKDNIGGIEYDGEKLTPESLKMQIRHYIATKAIIAERGFAFVGVKCHYDLSEYYYTQCLAAALSNDPYDWDGPKQPVVYACEADSDAALTMQLLKLISGKPALFMDFRHYDGLDKVFVFCNCGAMATWYSERSDNAAKNLTSVRLCPIISKYGGQGCHVRYIAKEGEMTLARLSRVLDSYKLTVFKGMARRLPLEKLNETCPVWPHAFVEVTADPLKVIDRYDSNHVHAVYGDYVEELRHFCNLKQIDFEVIE